MRALASIMLIILFSAAFFIMFSTPGVQAFLMSGTRASLFDPGGLRRLLEATVVQGAIHMLDGGGGTTLIDSEGDIVTVKITTSTDTSMMVEEATRMRETQLEEVCVSADTASKTVTISQETLTTQSKDVVRLTTLLTPPSGERMAEHPRVTGSVAVKMTLVYSDGSTRDITRLISVDVIGAFMDSAVGKEASKIRLTASGILRAEGLGDLGVLKLSVAAYMGYVVEPLGSAPAAASGVFFLTKESPSCSVNLVVEKTVGELVATNNLKVFSVLTVLADFREFHQAGDKNDYVKGVSREYTVLRSIVKRTVYEGPSCTTLFIPANPGGRELYPMPSALGTSWSLRFTKYPSLNAFEVVDYESNAHGLAPRWVGETFQATVMATATGTYAWRLEPFSGRWGNTEGSATVSTLSQAGGLRAEAYATIPLAITPRPQPVSGTLRIRFNGYTQLSSGQRVLIQDDAISVEAYRYSWDGSRYVETLIGRHTVGSGQAVEIPVSLSSWRDTVIVKHGVSKYQGTAEYRVAPGGDWYAYCASPTQTVTIETIAPYDADYFVNNYSYDAEQHTLRIEPPEGVAVRVETVEGTVEIRDVSTVTTGGDTVTIVTPAGETVVNVEGVSFIDLRVKRDGSVETGRVSVTPVAELTAESVLLIVLSVAAGVATVAAIWSLRRDRD